LQTVFLIYLGPFYFQCHTASEVSGHAKSISEERTQR
jgi:hypothetical protein